MANRLQQIDYEAVADFSDSRREIRETITELCATYSREAVCRELIDAGLIDEKAAVTMSFEILRSYTALLIKSQEPRLLAAMVGRLTGLNMMAGSAPSLEEIGRKYGLSKQAISKRVVRLAIRLHLPRLTSDKICQSHRLMNWRNHVVKGHS